MTSEGYAPISLWIGNLGKYAEGQLVGEWVELPCYDFDSVFERIGIDPDYDEWHCPDWDCYIPGLKYTEFPNFDRLEELNYYAETWEGMSDEEQEIAGLLMTEFGYDFDDAIEGIQDAVVWHDCEDMTDVARQYIEMCGGASQLDPQMLDMYFDYEAFGRDISYSGDMYDNERWNSFDNSTDAAFDLVEEMGGVRELGPDTLDMYFNYKAYGRDMDLEGSFFDSQGGDKIIEIVR